MSAVEFAINKLEKFIPSENQIVIDIIVTQAKELEEKQRDEYAIKFNIWLNNNCEQSNSKDNWRYYKSSWKTVDELLEIYKKENL